MNSPWDYLIDGRVAEVLEYDYETKRAYTYPETDIPEQEIIDAYDFKTVRNPRAKKSRRWVKRREKNYPGYFRGRNPKNNSRNPNKYFSQEETGGTLAESLWAERYTKPPVGIAPQVESRLAAVRRMA